MPQRCYLSSIFACNNLFEVVHVLVLLKSSIFFIHSPKYIGFIPTSALFTDNFFCLGSIKFCLVYLLKFCECTLYKNGKFQEGLVCSFVWSGWEIWNFELLEICWCNLSDKFHVRLLCLLEPHCKWLRKQPMFVVVQLHLRLGFSSFRGEINKKKTYFPKQCFYLHSFRVIRIALAVGLGDLITTGNAFTKLDNHRSRMLESKFLLKICFTTYFT